MRLLDLFCGAGGAGMGYHRAGFEVVGVDIAPQRHYPFEFQLYDALEYAVMHGHHFDVIHASPPCQRYSAITPLAYRDNHPDLIATTRRVLKSIGKPYVIENVGGAKRQLLAPILLCGLMFDLKTYRHRWFESSIMLLSRPHWPHRDNAKRGRLSRRGFVTVTGGGLTSEAVVAIQDLGYASGLEYRKFAMGIDWMTRTELSEAIPPAYTEYIGRQLMDVLERQSAA